MNSSNLRKRLLIAESDLNRAQMAGDISEFIQDARTIAHRAKTVGSVASAAGVLVAGLVTSRQKPADAPNKTSWIAKALNSAGMLSNLWQAIRSARRDQAKS